MQIQPFSVNDGDGIRTTVFMAGCPLRCRWCANPEGFAAHPLVGWYSRKCIGCGACAAVCPQGIGIDMGAGRSRCVACGACAAACPTGARAFMARRMRTEEILAEIRKHAVFYRYSGGGVSFSGGECTSQPELLDELTAQIYDMGYSMDMETCGYFDFDRVESALRRMDLIFMDLKVLDDAKHRRFTGVSNRRILANLERLGDVPADVVVRIPVIVGVNADEENIRRSAAYVRARLPKARMELLPYHRFGLMKYEALGLAYDHPEFTRPTAEAMARLKAIVQEEGVALADFT